MVAFWARFLLTLMPLRLPKSSTCVPDQSRRTLACLRETRSSLRTMSALSSRPKMYSCGVGHLDALALARPVHHAEVGLFAPGGQAAHHVFDDLACDELGVVDALAGFFGGDAVEGDVELGDGDDVAVAQQALLALGELLAVDLRAEARAEIFEEEEGAVARDAGVVARDGLLGQHHLAAWVAAEGDGVVIEQQHLRLVGSALLASLFDR